MAIGEFDYLFWQHVLAVYTANKTITAISHLAFCWGWGRAHCIWRRGRWGRAIVSWAGRKAWPCQGTTPPPTPPPRRTSAWCCPTLYFLLRLPIRTERPCTARVAYPVLSVVRSEQNSQTLRALLGAPCSVVAAAEADLARGARTRRRQRSSASTKGYTRFFISLFSLAWWLRF